MDIFRSRLFVVLILCLFLTQCVGSESEDTAKSSAETGTFEESESDFSEDDDIIDGPEIGEAIEEEIDKEAEKDESKDEDIVEEHTEEKEELTSEVSDSLPVKSVDTEERDSDDGAEDDSCLLYTSDAADDP